MLVGVLEIVRSMSGIRAGLSCPGTDLRLEAKASEAPVSTVPASYMQAQHIRGFHEFAIEAGYSPWQPSPGMNPGSATSCDELRDQRPPSAP